MCVRVSFCVSLCVCPHVYLCVCLCVCVCECFLFKICMCILGAWCYLLPVRSKNPENIPLVFCQTYTTATIQESQHATDTQDKRISSPSHSLTRHTPE